MIGFTIAVLGFLVATALPVAGQRHLPGLQIFDMPAPVLVDTRVESPPSYSGSRSAPYPATGQLLEFQVFVPLAAGRAGFASSIEFTGDPDTFAKQFQVRSAKDWDGTELSAVPGSEGTLRTLSRMSFSDVPYSGHILTVQLAPVGPGSAPIPLRMRCSVSIASIPPRRLMRAVGEQQITWR